jgi:hypothetical protein
MSVRKHAQTDIIFRVYESRTAGRKSACIQTILLPANTLRSSVVFLCPITNYESITKLHAALDASSAAHSPISSQIQPSQYYQNFIIILPTEQKIEHKFWNSFLCCVLQHCTLLPLAYLQQKDERAQSGTFLINTILFLPTPLFLKKKVFPVTTHAAFYSAYVSSYILSIRSTYLSSSYVTVAVTRNGYFKKWVNVTQLCSAARSDVNC